MKNPTAVNVRVIKRAPTPAATLAGEIEKLIGGVYPGVDLALVPVVQMDSWLQLAQEVEKTQFNPVTHIVLSRRAGEEFRQECVAFMRTRAFQDSFDGAGIIGTIEKLQAWLGDGAGR